MGKRYTKISVFGEQVRVIVNKGESIDSVLTRARANYIRRYYGSTAKGWGSRAESWSDYAVYLVCTVFGRETSDGMPVVGEFHWKKESGTDEANEMAIIAALFAA